MMKEIKITEIQIIPIKPKDGLVAFASCIIYGNFYIGNIAIYTSFSSLDGYRLVYPAKTLPNGKQINCIYPINRETGDAIQKAVIEKFQQIISGIEKR